MDTELFDLSDSLNFEFALGFGVYSLFVSSLFLASITVSPLHDEKV